MLLVHDIACAFDSDGTPWKDRADTLVSYLHLYPPMARQQLVEEFRLVPGMLLALEAAVLAEKIKKN